MLLSLNDFTCFWMISLWLEAWGCVPAPSLSAAASSFAAAPLELLNPATALAHWLPVLWPHSDVVSLHRAALLNLNGQLSLICWGTPPCWACIWATTCDWIWREPDLWWQLRHSQDLGAEAAVLGAEDGRDATVTWLNVCPGERVWVEDCTWGCDCGWPWEGVGRDVCGWIGIVGRLQSDPGLKVRDTGMAPMGVLESVAGSGREQEAVSGHCSWGGHCPATWALEDCAWVGCASGGTWEATAVWVWTSGWVWVSRLSWGRGLGLGAGAELKAELKAERVERLRRLRLGFWRTHADGGAEAGFWLAAPVSGTIIYSVFVHLYLWKGKEQILMTLERKTVVF